MKRFLFLGILFISCIFIAYFFILAPDDKPLPVINPVDVESEMVDSSLNRIGYGHKIGAFSFLDQNGKAFGSKQLEEKIYVAEYFFTTCGTICPIMNAQMTRVQETFKSNLDVQILSFTVDPEIDTVEQMKRYSQMHNANDKQWHFLTGKKEDLYQLARTSFFVLKPAEVENQGDAGSDFIHTNNFVLVDRKKQIRGFYDGTSDKEVDQMILDIQKLLEN
jgi:protein SCO1/2